MSDILVEIIDLQICSSLKLDGVYKKGTSWAGPRPIYPAATKNKIHILFGNVCLERTITRDI